MNSTNMCCFPPPKNQEAPGHIRDMNADIEELKKHRKEQELLNKLKNSEGTEANAETTENKNASNSNSSRQSLLVSIFHVNNNG